MQAHFHQEIHLYKSQVLQSHPPACTTSLAQGVPRDVLL